MSRLVLSKSEIISAIEGQSVRSRAQVSACYISWMKGIVTDPKWILIPMDDHMVHRGDGVFEAIKFVDKKPYLLRPHLSRLQNSAKQLSFKAAHHLENIEELIKETLEVSGLESGLIRLFLSRGSGSYTTNPYDPENSELVIAVMELKPPKPSHYEEGVSVGISKVSPKESFWAQVKSCNYLPNVMMKKEAVDLGLDYMIGVTETGELTESSTENLILVDAHGLLCRPKKDRILRGCTMIRAFELASENRVAETFEKALTVQDLISAKEVMMVGTTLDVLPVTKFEGKKIGSGHVGPVAQKLLKLIKLDQTSN